MFSTDCVFELTQLINSSSNAFLRPIWAKTTQKDALLGIGMTGIGSGEILKYNLDIAANTAKVVTRPEFYGKVYVGQLNNY